MNRYSTWAATLVACALLASCNSAPLTMGVVDPEQITSGSIAPEAQNCTLQRRASVPVTLAGLPLISATINGRQARLILDTGAESSIISVAAAKRLGVTTKYDFARSMHGIGEAVQTGDARLDGMMLGGATLNFPRAAGGPDRAEPRQRRAGRPARRIPVGRIRSGPRPAEPPPRPLRTHGVPEFHSALERPIQHAGNHPPR